MKVMKTNDVKRLDRTVLLILIAFFVASLTFIYSNQLTGYFGMQDFVLKQGINYVIGFTLLYFTSKLDVDQMERLAWPSYILLFFMIIALKFAPGSIAPNILGAKRWFNIPLLGSIQPSEFFKIALIFLVAHLITKHNEIYHEKKVTTDLLLIGKILLVAVPPTIMVYIQPDTGMVFLYFIAIGAMLYVSGMNKKLASVLILVPLIIVGALVYLYFYHPNVIYKDLIPKLSPHQQSRILGWLNPAANDNQAYQTNQSLLAVGSGEMFGKGILKGNVYIPEKYTDFIFSTVAEEGGFVGASIIITLFFLLILKVVSTGLKSETAFGSYICAGIAFSMTAQIFQNIGMVVGLMPVKGISLPFLTYGGSSLFSNMILIGIVLSIRKTSSGYMFGARSGQGET
jgi:cell division protein FtsW (lipid II flippase)